MRTSERAFAELGLGVGHAACLGRDDVRVLADRDRPVAALSVGLLLVVFIAAAATTWVAGAYLSRATDVFDDRFGLGDAVGGLLLLGLAGSLPELANTASHLRANPRLHSREESAKTWLGADV